MSIEHLNLAGAAKAGAQALLDQYPEIVFTSGRRAVADQARAMASNIVQRRQWIALTYKPTDESRALQDWVDTHPAAISQGAIAAGLTAVMESWPPERLAKVSKHFTGQAFDVHPVAGARGAQIKASIRALPGLAKFLEKEGGLIRWHAQFD